MLWLVGSLIVLATVCPEVGAEMALRESLAMDVVEVLGKVAVADTTCALVGFWD